MNKLKFLMVTGLLAATAACSQTGYDNTYAYNNGYNTRPANNNAYYDLMGRTWRVGLRYSFQ